MPIELASSAGCVTSVRASVSAGPMAQSLLEVEVEHVRGLVVGVAHPRIGGAEVAAHADGLRPLPGEHQCELVMTPSGRVCRSSSAYPECAERDRARCGASQLPLGEARAPGEPGAEPGHEQHVALLEAAVLAGLVQAERDGGARGVAVAVEVGEDLLLGESQRRAAVSMMRMLAWCGTNRSTSSTVRSASPSTFSHESTTVRVANLNTSLPVMCMACSCCAHGLVAGRQAACRRPAC